MKSLYRSSRNKSPDGAKERSVTPSCVPSVASGRAERGVSFWFACIAGVSTPACALHAPSGFPLHPPPRVRPGALHGPRSPVKKRRERSQRCDLSLLTSSKSVTIWPSSSMLGWRSLLRLLTSKIKNNYKITCFSDKT